ncbi:HDIG domain-containing protein [Candidatus Wolfebacteria bacterium]|nr:HDIG domain-containing protein [Candidatus Wolfebacteria bacterium]
MPGELLRDRGLTLLRAHVKNQNLLKHSLAVEALMKALARKFSENEELWGLAGLVHDLDWEETQNDFERHSLVAAEILEKEGFPAEVVKAVKIHNYVHGLTPETPLEKALYATEEITGLIAAAVLVLPSRKIVDLKPESVLNRMKEKAFARGVNRDIINLTPSFLGISVAELTEIALGAMREIHEELGL